MNKDKINEYIEDLLTVGCCPGHDYSCKEVYKYVKQLQSNWNSLREWINENSWYYNTSDGCQWVDQFKLLDKMNELEELEGEDDIELEEISDELEEKMKKL